MAIIKTLGPSSTDSFCAAEHWLRNNKDLSGDAQIKLYPNMESVFADIQTGDLIVMPAGYTNRNNPDFSGWVDYHYYYSDILDVIDVFSLDTMEMIVVENTDYKLDRAIVQSSTVQLLKRNGIECKHIDYSPSKSYGLSLFDEMSYRYVICSSSDYEKNRSEDRKKSDRIIERVNIHMIWVVYKAARLKNYPAESGAD